MRQGSSQDPGGTLVAPQPGEGGSSRESPLFGPRRARPSGEKPVRWHRLFAVRELLLKLLCSLRALLFGLDKSGSGVPPLAPAPWPMSPSFHLPENPAQPGSTLVAQASKPAVSRVSKPAGREHSPSLPTWKSATQQVWKPALRPIGALLWPLQFVRLTGETPARPADSQFLRLSNSLFLSNLHLPEACGLSPEHRRDGGTNSSLLADKLPRVLPVSTNWHLACCQCWNPSGVCPVLSQQPPARLSHIARSDKRKYLSFRTKRMPEPVGLCPENRPDGGTNSPVFLVRHSTPCRADLPRRSISAKAGASARRREPCKGGSTLDPSRVGLSDCLFHTPHYSIGRHPRNNYGITPHMEVFPRGRV
jgi:hypothetical protein